MLCAAINQEIQLPLHSRGKRSSFLAPCLTLHVKASVLSNALTAWRLQEVVVSQVPQTPRPAVARRTSYRETTTVPEKEGQEHSQWTQHAKSRVPSVEVATMLKPRAATKST